MLDEDKYHFQKKLIHIVICVALVLSTTVLSQDQSRQAEGLDERRACS